ncbi:MAG: DPP IV N-terminal domain-containing protein [Saprospiraceae bacterium]|jgi:dipeptidyl-peptidase-4|nr:DPP IV N-terminal domain-containing protein [Saprospiraceae bacterium]
MKKTIFYIFSIFLCSYSINLVAQDPIEVLGWLDDEHYLIEKINGEEKTTFKVNAKSGKESAHTPERGILETLPEGVRLRRGNTFYSSDRKAVVISKDNDLFYFKKGESTLRQLTANPQKENNPTFSPDGEKIAFTREHDLYILYLETGLEKRLTNDGTNLIYNGWASWVYYEEILGRGSRYRAFYWSPDSERIAFLNFDDSQVPEFPIYHHIGGDGVHGMLEATRYPKSGDPNPAVKLGIVEIEKGITTWVATDTDFEYTAWIFWTPDASELIFQQLNRDQNHLVINAANSETGISRKLYTEKQTTWVEFFEEIHFLDNNKGFIIRSNSDGWYNLYHYDMSGNLVRKITDFDWRITDIVMVDEENERIFFKGMGSENPTESHFFVININGKKFKQLTKGAGSHDIRLSNKGSYFIDNFSSYSNPGETDLMDTKGAKLNSLKINKTNPNDDAGLVVESFTIPTSDGFDLPAYWVLPPNFDKTKKYPIIFNIYGGPDAGTVSNRFRNFSWNQLYQKGVIRITVDHRASGKFGKKGLDYMHKSLGKWEMHDYIEAVKWLRTQPFIDSTKVGIQGSSYGGYMTALALTYGADYFTHGVASASVTDWRLYDNIYTERYMDEPKDNKKGYDFGSVMTHVEKLKGELLIVHGTIDDNVHMQNSIQLISELQEKGKDFEMMVYPGGRHGWGGAKGMHSYNLSQKFWEKHFFGKPTKP